MVSGSEPQVPEFPKLHFSSGEPIEINTAGWRDVGALRTLEQVCFPKDAWPLWDLIGVLTLPNMVRLKAVLGEQMVGFVAGDYRMREQVAWIATICVQPEYQRRGIGRALLEACERQLPVAEVRLCVRVSNTGAQAMYRGAGYGVREIWEKYYSDGEDALVMQKNRLALEKGYNKLQ
jgi:ribosomal protein S18 acetylase RimI-like enzyme